MKAEVPLEDHDGTEHPRLSFQLPDWESYYCLEPTYLEDNAITRVLDAPEVLQPFLDRLNRHRYVEGLVSEVLFVATQMNRLILGILRLKNKT